MNASRGPAGTSSRNHKARAPGTEMALGRSSTPGRVKILWASSSTISGCGFCSSWVCGLVGVVLGRDPAPLRQDAFVHLFSTPARKSVVGHMNTLRELGSTRYRFFPLLEGRHESGTTKSAVHFVSFLK